METLDIPICWVDISSVEHFTDLPNQFHTHCNVRPVQSTSLIVLVTKFGYYVKVRQGK